MDPKFYSNNRKKLLGLVKSNVIIIRSNVLIQKSLDQAYEFKQDNNFFYLTGINQPDIVLFITKNEEFLIVPELSKSRESFEGAIDHKDLIKTSAVKQVLNQKEGWDKVRKILSKTNKVATLMPSSKIRRYYGIFPAPARQELIAKLRRLSSRGLVFEDIIPLLARQRMVKDDKEIKLIKKAIDITTETLNEALNPPSLRSLKTAKELEAVIEFGFKSRGASRMSFDPIIALGKKATTIHYTKNDQKLSSNELIVIDVGCEYQGYCSDISRTICLSQPTSRQKEVLEAVSQVQTKVIQKVKAGLLMKDIEQLTEDLIGDQLINLGLIKIKEKKAIRKYYPHSVSHHLGLDVHDLADYKLPLPVNSVITIEPGIYIPEESIGVRLEDDVLVRIKDCLVLSSKAA